MIVMRVYVTWHDAAEPGIFYDVDEANAVVVVRAVRRKPPHTTTEEIV